MVRSNFSTALEAAERLSFEEKETLLEVLRHRAVAERRNQIKREIAQSNDEHAAGKSKAVSPAQLMRELLR
ncbi:MAG TPA: hypothetical protein VGN88_08540 [Phycisphaerae bacterium]